MEVHQKWIDSVAKSNTKSLLVYAFNSNYLLDYFYMYFVSNSRQLIDFFIYGVGKMDQFPRAIIKYQKLMTNRWLKCFYILSKNKNTNLKI